MHAGAASWRYMTPMWPSKGGTLGRGGVIQSLRARVEWFGWLCFVSVGVRKRISCTLILQFTRQAVYGDIVNGCFPPFSQRSTLIPVSLTLPRLQEEGLRSGSCLSERNCPGSCSGRVSVCLCAFLQTTRTTTSILICNNEEMDGCGQALEFDLMCSCFHWDCEISKLRQMEVTANDTKLLKMKCVG